MILEVNENGWMILEKESGWMILEEESGWINDTRGWVRME